MRSCSARNRFHFGHRARDQRQRRALREPGCIGLFVHIPQRLRCVDDQRACQLRAIQDIGRVDILHIEWRILAHQDHIEIAQFDRPAGPKFEPVVVIITNCEPRRLAHRFAREHAEIALLEIVNFGAATHGFEQHCEGASPSSA